MLTQAGSFVRDVYEAQDLKRDVDLLKNEGISFEEMVKTLFKVEKAAMKATFSSWDIETNADFQAGKLDLKNVLSPKVDKSKRHMYPPFAKMGNDVVRCAIDSYGPQANKIKLLPCGGKVLKSHFTERKPDVLLVPQYDGQRATSQNVKVKGTKESDSSGVEITRDNLCWWHALFTLEFKRDRPKEGKSGEKRPLDSLTEPGNAESNRPAKAVRPSGSRGDSTAGASSSRTGSKQQGRPLRNSKTRESKVTSSARTTSSMSKDTRDPETQLASYAAEMLSANGDRIYVLGLLVKDTKVYLRYYHQSCVVMSDGIDFFEDFTPLAILLMLYVKREVGQVGFGFNPVTGYINPFDTKSEKTTVMHCKLVPIHEDGTPSQLVNNADIHRKERVHTNYSLLGRGTAVHDVEAPQNASKNLELVVKSSWQVTSRAQEHKLIAEARKIDTKHVVQVFGQAVVADNSPSDVLREKCSRKSEEYEKKEIRIIVERKYKSISEIEDPELFWKVFIQCLRCAHRLYSKGDILHRDISINNLGYYIDENGEYVGVLLDFDLASMGPPQQSTRAWSGTAPFMAREVLDVSKAYTHRFRHELESFLYVAIWHALGYRQEKFPKEDILHGWRKGSWESIMEAKDGFISNSWIRVFPDPDPDDDFLHIRCGLLCYYFHVVDQDLKAETLMKRKNIFGKKRGRGPARENTDSTIITFRSWLEYAGEAEDSDACDKDCCVE